MANTVNFEASISARLVAGLPGRTLVFDAPAHEGIYPCISVVYHTVDSEPLYFKTATTRSWRHAGLVDASVWVSRASPNWLELQREMVKELLGVFKGGVLVPVDDYSTDPPTRHANIPALYQSTIEFHTIKGRGALPDLHNPDLERRRFVIEYTAKAVEGVT